jgi:hypothetical protein
MWPRRLKNSSNSATYALSKIKFSVKELSGGEHKIGDAPGDG